MEIVERTNAEGEKVKVGIRQLDDKEFAATFKETTEYNDKGEAVVSKKDKLIVVKELQPEPVKEPVTPPPGSQAKAAAEKAKSAATSTAGLTK